MKQTGNGFKLLSLTVVLTLLIGLITVIPVGAANATDEGFSQPNFSGFSLEDLPSGWSLERKGTNLSSTNLISIKDGKLNLELKDTDAKGGSNYQTLTRTFDPVTGNATLNLDFTTNFGNGEEAPDNGISESWFGVPGYFYLNVVNAGMAQKLIRVMSWGGTQAFYIIVQDGVSYHMTANINPQSHICSFVFTDGTGADVTRYDPSNWQPATKTEYELKPKSGEEVPTSIDNVFFRTSTYAKSGKFNIDIQSAELKVKKAGNGFNQLDFSDFSFNNLPDGWELTRRGTNESSTNLMSIKDGKLNLELKDTDSKGSGNYQTLTRTFDPVTGNATLNLDFTTNFGNGEERPDNGTCEKWFGVPGYFYLTVVNAHTAQKLIRVMSWGGTQAFYIRVQDGVSYHMTAIIDSESHVCSFMFTDETGTVATRYNPSSNQPETETEYELKPKSGEGVPTSIDNVLFRTSTYAASGKINIDIQSVRLYLPQAPTVDTVTVTGMTGTTGRTGDVLKAEAAISDPDDDQLEQPIYQWYRSVDGQDPWEKIEDANNQTYFCTNNDLTQYIRIGVTPVSAAEPARGEETFSDPVGPIEPGDTRPAISTVTIQGAVFINNVLTAKFDFFSPAGKGEGTHRYSWEISDSQEGNYTTVATTEQYAPQTTEEGKWLRVSVTPVDEDGLEGKVKTSDPVLISGAYQTFYVATNGNDKNDGSLEAPFATIEHARNVVRSIKKTKPIKVILRGGVYQVSSKILFDSRDSGTEDCPITYCAYPGETVTLSGSTKLNAAKAVKVTDPAILNRLVDENAREKLMMLDLGAQGIEKINPMKEGYGDGYWNNYPEMSVFYDGLELTPARWPNEGFLQVSSVDVDRDNYKTAPFTMYYEDDENRAEKWSAEAFDNLFIGNRNSFSFQAQQVSVDIGKHSVTSKAGSNYIVEPRCMFYFFNLLDEIDLPGESYIDRENKILYYYPPNDHAQPSIEINTLDSEIASLSGVSYVNFEGLKFDGSRRQLFVASDIDHVNINGCEFSHCSSSAVNITRGTNLTLENNHIYDTGTGGIHLLESGDRISLTSGNVVIRNNRIHNVDRIARSYAPAIRVGGSVGTVIENNELYDAKHMLVFFESSNDIQFNYNKVYNAMTWFDDMSAVYYGRDSSMLGMEFKYNFFHDNGNSLPEEQFGTHSLFWDDAAAGPLVYGNIFYRGTKTKDEGGQPKIDNPIKTYYGQQSRIENNIIVDAPSAFSYTTYGFVSTWMLLVYSVPNHQSGWNHWGKLEALNYDSDIWKAHYENTQWSWLNNYIKREYKQQLDAMDQTDSKAFETQVRKFANEHLFPDEGSNVFSKNVLAKVDVPVQTPGYAKSNIRTEQNYTMSNLEAKSAFVEYGKDFRLTDDALAKVRQTIPDFENIPTDKIGLQPYWLNGVELSVGGSVPAASNLSLNTDVIPGATVKPVYNYFDPDGDLEGYSEVAWYTATTENGQYKKLETPYRDTFMVDEEMIGQYIRYTVQPIDNRGVRGEIVQSDSYRVIDTANALLSAILIDGQSLKNFSSSKFSYIISANAVPNVTPVLSDEKASYTIENAANVPGKTVIHVTARDGVSTQEYTLIWRNVSSPTPAPTYTPNGSANQGTPNGSANQGTKGQGIFNSAINASPAPTSNQIQFTDTIGHWAESDIDAMTERRIVNGVTATSFEPDRSITRAEFATIIVKALGLTANVSEGFSDLETEAWYTSYVNAAASAGLIVGYNGKFRPNDLITREEMAVIVDKAYTFMGNTAQTGQISRFSDANEISDWAYGAVDRAATVGLINGKTGNTFQPKDNATRAECASLIWRMIR